MSQRSGIDGPGTIADYGPEQPGMPHQVTVTLFHAASAWLQPHDAELLELRIKCVMSKNSYTQQARVDLATVIWPTDSDKGPDSLELADRRGFLSALRSALEASLGRKCAAVQLSRVDFGEP